MNSKHDISGTPGLEKKIAFLDLTGGKEFNLKSVIQMPLGELLNKIKADTGRDIQINYIASLGKIGIVKYDLPIGYALFANEKINKNQILFNYGGVTKKDGEADLSNAYLLSLDNGYSLDAKMQGDLGSLCMHLFDSVQLQGRMEVGIEETQFKSIQFHNLKKEKIQSNHGVDFQFRALDAIPQGSLLGFSYGYSYWLTRNTSPILMARNGNPIVNLCVKKPLFCLRSCDGDLSLGTIVYRREDLLYHLNKHQNKTLCVFWPPAPENPVAFMNTNSIRTALNKTTFSGVFEFLEVKKISSTLLAHLAKQNEALVLPHSIHANSEQYGPFADSYMFGNSSSEEHDISEWKSITM